MIFRIASLIAFSTRKLPPARLGRTYRVKLASTGGLAPKSWKVQRGVLPNGIRLDRALGVLTGLPTRPGRYRMTFQVVDKLGVASSRSLVIHVVP